MKRSKSESALCNSQLLLAVLTLDGMVQVGTVPMRVLVFYTLNTETGAMKACVQTCANSAPIATNGQAGRFTFMVDKSSNALSANNGSPGVSFYDTTNGNLYACQVGNFVQHGDPPKLKCVATPIGK
jgi:hypothetical protein